MAAPLPPPTIAYLTDVWFEPGAALWPLPQVLDRLGITRPLVVTDRGVVAAGLLDGVAPDVAVAAPVFDAVDANPTEANVLAGLDAYRANRCDGVVAIGGGSPIDCGKAVALLATHPPPLRQYAFVEGGLPRITASKPKVLAVPTTAGTGSEVGRAALIAFPDGAKLALISPRMIPDAVICDPKLTLGLSPALTAATGMDAISHCVETFCSPRFNPVADAIALDGLSRAWRNLPVAFGDGANLEARSEMMLAALQGGLTFQKGLGAVHSLSHPLGGLPGKRLHHGTLNAVFLPHFLRFNRDACPEKLQQIGHAIGIDAGGADALPQAFERLTRDLGLPTRLRDMGVTPEDLEAVEAGALRDHSTLTNPRRMELDDVRTLLQAAY